MMTRNRTSRRVVAVLCAVLGICGVARAQSAVGGFDPGANNEVQTLVVEPDGKILVGGYFSTLGGGGSGTTTRNRIGRLNADGSLDTSFNPGVPDLVTSVVRVMAVQTDGKILVGGWFTGLGGGTGTTPRSNIGRLNADGSVDSTFNPGADGIVQALVVQADGKILVGGSFTTLGGGGTGTTARNGIARLEADGSVDTGFYPGAGPFSATRSVTTMVVQTDGKILVGGGFISGATPSNGIGRLEADGSVDSAFNPPGTVFTASSSIFSMAVQPDGKILVGGCFISPSDPFSCSSVLHRLNVDGSLDTSFNPVDFGAWVKALALQTDGKILVGGVLSMPDGTGNFSRNVGRVNADGSPDASFHANANGFMVDALAMRADGTLLVGGGLSALGGAEPTPRHNIGLLTNTDAATERLSVSGGGSVVSWARGGAGPELSRATFELSTDGVTYTAPASGTHVSDGWQAIGQSLPPNQNLYIRARGYYATGYGNGSGSVVESIAYVAPPTMSGFPNAHTRRDTPITVPFTVGVGSGASAMTVSASSSNTTAVPNANLVLGGTGASRTLTITPALHQTGATTITLTASDGGLTASTSFVLVVYANVPGDFDGHGTTNLTVFRPSTGTWFIANPGMGTAAGIQWGNGLDVPVPGDYDGDGKTDVAVFRPSNGTWFIVNSSTAAAVGVQWGNGSDVPVPGDYDGDGKTDIAVFRPSNGTWFIVNSGTGTAVGIQWGNGNDVPVPGDYDGDGKTDIAVFRPSNGTWFIVYSGTGTAVGIQWGNGLDVPVPGDYDGDGETDIAVFRPSNGTWFIVNSATGIATGVQWGNGNDIPILKR